MRRLGAIIGLPALLSLSLSYYFGNTFIYIAFILAFVLIILSVIIKKYRSNNSFRIICLSVMVSLMVFSCYTSFVYEPEIKNYSNKELNIVATVKEAPYKSLSSYYYHLETTMIDNKEDDVDILLKTRNNLDTHIDDILSFNGDITATTNDTYKSRGYYLTAEPIGKVIINSSDSHSFLYYPSVLREYLEEVINNNMSEDISDICNALAFGNKADVDNSTKEIFRESGLSHILVVSGLHISILSFAILFVLRRIIKKRNIYCPLTILFVLLYMLMIGFSPSVIRSGIMMIIVIIGEMIWREADSLNSLGVSALILIIINPYSAGDVGLLLSFSATLGIILFSSHIRNYILERLTFKRQSTYSLVKKVIDVISVTFSAVLTTTPIIIIFFKKLSLTQIPSNLFIEPVFQVLIICIFVGAILGLTGISFLYYPFLFVAEKLAQYVLLVAKIMSEVPFGYISTDKPFVYVWLFITCGFVIAIILMKNYKKTIPFCALASLLVLCTGMVCTHIYDYNTPVLSVYNSGNGVFTAISYKDKNAVLSCGGSKGSNIVNSLLKDYNHINIVSATSTDNSNSKYFKDIVSQFDLNRIFIYDGSTDLESDNVVRFKKDHTADMNDIIVKYLVRDGKVFTYTQCVDKTILIIPENGDCQLLDKMYRTPDLVITARECKNGNLISAEEHIVCCTEESYSEFSRENCINSEKIKATFKGDLKESLG